jgi:hypothetical protein
MGLKPPAASTKRDKTLEQYETDVIAYRQFDALSFRGDCRIQSKARRRAWYQVL